jgi:hypothetical protein
LFIEFLLLVPTACNIDVKIFHVMNKNLAHHIGLILLQSSFGDSEPKGEVIQGMR